MCRIAGIVNKHSEGIQQEVQAMTQSMKHGGPDDHGHYYDADNGYCTGHRRLSIIDLSAAGHQPMSDSNENYVITYNGEVYNFLELKNELTRKGYQFKTHTDTEVILKGYECWGEESFAMLKGMFAFALYDKAKGELILARDPSGIKPLYYYYQNATLYYASEIRAFKQTGRFEENPDWKYFFLTYGFLPEPVTTLRNVQPLEKGTYLKYYIKEDKVVKKAFYHLSYKEQITDPEEARDAIKKSLEDAVKRHLISDAPLGFFLSGGIDSSLLTLIGNQFKKEDLHTLSIVFDDPNYSERKYQELIAEQCHSKHHPFKLEKDMFLNALPDIFKAMDQPSTDGINTYFICKYAKEAGLKAVISGLGADELLGGYASFKNTGLASKLRKAPNLVLQGAAMMPQYKYKKVSFLQRRDAIGEYLFNRGYYSADETAKILGTTVADVSGKLRMIQVPGYVNELKDGNRISYLESSIYMQSQLLKDTDVMSMWHSIEVRVPFLDVDFLNVVNSISPEIKYNNPLPKFLLVDSFNELLPREIWNRKKQGFVFPFQEWMKSNKGAAIEGHKNKRLETLYQQGKLNWSRYWAYLVSAMYQS